MTDVKVADVWVRSSVSPWIQLGFETRVSGDETFIDLPDLSLRFLHVGASQALGVCGWTVCAQDIEAVTSMSVDGIDTKVTPCDSGVQTPAHRLGVVGVDHIVILTGSLDRTCSALAEHFDVPLKRVRDAGNGVRQGFHRLGSVILEVVERPDIDTDTPAWLWGLVFNVDDLDAATAWLGPDVVGAPRDAVQPGRRIATVREQAGLGIPLALMTPSR